MAQSMLLMAIDRLVMAMDEYFDVELTSDIFEKLHDPEQVEYYRRKYFTSPEFNRLAARFPAAAKEAEKRCKA